MTVASAVPVSIAACRRSRNSQCQLLDRTTLRLMQLVRLTVVALPPVESFSSNQEVEDEAKDEPERVLSFAVLVDISD